MRAAQTEVLEENPDLYGETGAEGNKSSAEENGSTDFCGSDNNEEVEEVEVDVYDNDYYSWVSDDDIMAAMTEMSADQGKHGERDIKM